MKKLSILRNKCLLLCVMVMAQITAWADSVNGTSKASEFFSRPGVWIGMALLLGVIAAAIFTGNSGNPHANKNNTVME
ncbi:MAG: hypothetical protein IPP72_06845 [Chitinophagaceae bacterium]|nr:hypothetical protein [Chitinophagaceae bacterium]